MLHQWVSRFRLWPYLEQFALDCAHEIQQEFGTNPDFVIGNNRRGQHWRWRGCVAALHGWSCRMVDMGPRGRL